MSVLSDIFVASANDLTAELADQGPAGRFKTLASNDIDTVKLATLHAILVGDDLSDIDAVLKRGSRAIEVGSRESSWLFEVLPDLTSRIEALEPSQLKVVKAAWLETEEWQNDAWPTEEFDKWFDEFRQFTRESRQTGKMLMLWMSL